MDVIFLVLLNMGVIVKKQLFMSLLMGLDLFCSANLNSMDLHRILNHDGVADVHVAGGAVPEVVAPAGVRAGGRVPAVAPVAPVAGAAAAIPANRQALTNVFKKLFMAPWELGSSITSMIYSSTTNVEPATKVLMRCVLEGFFCGICFYLASNDAIGSAANRRWQLADFALEDLFSQEPFHYTSSRLWIAISGLQYFVTFLGLSGLRLYAWLFGIISGFRCAYDSLIRLPISVVFERSEDRRRMQNQFRFGGFND